MTRILLVEDEPMQQMMFAHLLRGAGHEITVASSAEEALDILTQDQNFDLILSDYQMGTMNGLQLLGAVKSDSRMQNIRFMLHTSDNTRQVREECERIGGKFRHKLAEVLREKQFLPEEVRVFLHAR